LLLVSLGCLQTDRWEAELRDRMKMARQHVNGRRGRILILMRNDFSKCSIEFVVLDSMGRYNFNLCSISDLIYLVAAMFGLFAYKDAALVQVYRDNEDLKLIFPGGDEYSNE
ncbi:hypothetical protein C5167_014313, partial [Papaver somniferum]